LIRVPASSRISCPQVPQTGPVPPVRHVPANVATFEALGSSSRSDSGRNAAFSLRVMSLRGRTSVEFKTIDWSVGFVLTPG
jgi:hypothetical protein